MRIRRSQDGSRAPDPDSYGGRPDDYIIVGSVVEQTSLHGRRYLDEELEQRANRILGMTGDWLDSHLLLLGSVTVVYPEPRWVDTDPHEG